MEKPCNKCGVVKPLDEFYKRAKHRDGHSNTCKVCYKAHNAKYKRDVWQPRHKRLHRALAWDEPHPMPLWTDEELEWKKDALCKEYPELDFINARVSRTESKRAKALRAVCGECLVFAECRALTDAIETPVDFSKSVMPSHSPDMLAGFWAGELPIERVRRRYRAAGMPLPPWLNAGKEIDEDCEASGEVPASGEHSGVL